MHEDVFAAIVGLNEPKPLVRIEPLYGTSRHVCSPFSKPRQPSPGGGRTASAAVTRVEGTATATGYAWLIWEKGSKGTPRLMWVPPSRKKHERDADYSAV